MYGSSNDTLYKTVNKCCIVLQNTAVTTSSQIANGLFTLQRVSVLLEQEKYQCLLLESQREVDVRGVILPF